MSKISTFAQFALILFLATPAFAGAEGLTAVGAALAISVAAFGGALGQGRRCGLPRRGAALSARAARHAQRLSERSRPRR